MLLQMFRLLRFANFPLQCQLCMFFSSLEAQLLILLRLSLHPSEVFVRKLICISLSKHLFHWIKRLFKLVKNSCLTQFCIPTRCSVPSSFLLILLIRKKQQFSNHLLCVDVCVCMCVYIQVNACFFVDSLGLFYYCAPQCHSFGYTF